MSSNDLPVPEQTTTHIGLRSGAPCVLCSAPPTTTMDIESAAGFRFKGPELATVQGILKDAPCCERCKSRYEARSSRWGCTTGIGALLGGLAVAFFSVRATYWADHSASLFEKIAGTIFGGGLVFVLAAAASAAAVVALRLVITFPQRLRVNAWLAKWRIT